MIYPLKPTHRLTVNVSYPHVGIITFADDTTLMYAASNEPNGPVAVAYADNWMQSESGSVFFSNEDTLMRNDSTPVEVLTGITINATSTTFSNMPKGIKSIQMDATLLDFTLAGISAIESASGRSLALAGFANEAEAFTEVPDFYTLFSEVSSWDLNTDGNITAYRGRANVEVLKVKPTNNINPAFETSDDGWILVGGGANGIEKVEILAGEKEEGIIIGSSTNSILLVNDEIKSRMGDMDIPTNKLKAVGLTLVFYFANHEDGVVISTSGSSGSGTMSLNSYRV